MTDHDIAIRAARAAFAYQCLINGIGPDDQEIEWRRMETEAHDGQ